MTTELHQMTNQRTFEMLDSAFNYLCVQDVDANNEAMDMISDLKHEIIWETTNPYIDVDWDRSESNLTKYRLIRNLQRIIDSLDAERETYELK